MKRRVISLFVTFAMLISIIPSTAIVACATSIQSENLTSHLVDVKVYDDLNTLTGNYEFQYDGRFLIGVTSRTYGEYAYESSTVLSYDNYGRLISRIAGDPDTPGMNSGTKYTYDNEGNLISSIQWEGGAVETSYEYDSTGKCIREIEKSDTSSKVTEYQYDGDGLIESAVEKLTEDWSGNTWTADVNYTYDSQKRVVKVSSSGGQVNSTSTFNYQYEPFVLYEYSDNNGFSYSYLLLKDDNGDTLYSFYLNNPELYADDSGNLGKVLDTDSYSHQVKTYILTYDGVDGEIDNPSIPLQAVAWNQAYYDYIVDDRKAGQWKSETYELLYIDNDEIPEIWIYYEPTGQRGELISYQNGSIERISTGRWDFEYAQSNMYFHCGGGTFGTGGCWDTIYALKDGTFQEVATGSYNSGTGNYDETVSYIWNGQTVTQEVYNSSIEQYLDPEITKRTYSDNSESYNYEGILKYLSSVKIENTRALEQIGNKAPTLVPKILSGEYKISHKNVMALSEMTPEEIKKVSRRIERSQQPYVQYNRTRREIQEQCTEAAEAESRPAPSVKDMPAFDPDAEITGLTLTIPSWASSIERTRTKTNLTIISSKARENLIEALLNLQIAIEEMREAVREK